MKYKRVVLLLIIINIVFSLTAFSAAVELVDFSTNSHINQNTTPEVFADSAILLDIKENKILYEKNSKNVMYPASTTKLMTAILVADMWPDMSQKATVSYYAVHNVPYSYATANLVPGEQLSVKDLLSVLLIPSANDAAYVLAQFIASNGNTYPTDSSASSKSAFDTSMTQFSELMNNKAKELGCLNTHFINPNGIHDESHYTTAYDLMLIGKYAYQKTQLRDICKETECVLPNTDKYTSSQRSFHTTNDLLRSSKPGYYSYANGLKTGFTDPAQECIIASASKDGRDLIAIILHSEESNNDENTSRESDCKRLFEYGFNNFSYSTLINKDSVVKTMNIFNGDSETRELNVLCQDELKTFIVHGQIIDATPEINITKTLAPISKGEVIGSITYSIDDNVYTSNLIAEHDVYSINYLIYILIIAIVFFIILIIFIRFTRKNKRKSRKKSKKRFN